MRLSRISFYAQIKKIILAVYSILFSAAGITIMFYGTHMRNNANTFDHERVEGIYQKAREMANKTDTNLDLPESLGLEKYINLPGWIAIALGALCLLIGIMGILGAILQNRVLLVAFNIFIIIFALVTLGLGIGVFVFLDKTQIGQDLAARKIFRDNLDTQFEVKKNHPVTTAMQAILECCGDTGPSDYDQYRPKEVNDSFYPASCCGRHAIHRGLELFDCYSEAWEQSFVKLESLVTAKCQKILVQWQKDEDFKKAFAGAIIDAIDVDNKIDAELKDLVKEVVGKVALNMTKEKVNEYLDLIKKMASKLPKGRGQSGQEPEESGQSDAEASHVKRDAEDLQLSDKVINRVKTILKERMPILKDSDKLKLGQLAGDMQRESAYCVLHEPDKMEGCKKTVESVISIVRTVGIGLIVFGAISFGAIVFACCLCCAVCGASRKD